jgi:hypothetical protein
MKAIILISLLFAFSCAFGFFPKKAENLKEYSNVQINTAYAARSALAYNSSNLRNSISDLDSLSNTENIGSVSAGTP